MDAKRFWERVFRSLDGVKDSWLADKIGVSPSTLSTWKTKERLPGADQAVAIARALGVTVEYLVTGTDSSDPWVREHRELIRDLKELSSDDLEKMSAQVHAVAEMQRQPKSSAS